MEWHISSATKQLSKVIMLLGLLTNLCPKNVILFVNFIGFKGKAKLAVSRRPKVNVNEKKKLLENYRINSAEKRTTIEGFSKTNSEVGITEYVFCDQSFPAEQSRS
jgi:hypothetical protein